MKALLYIILITVLSQLLPAQENNLDESFKRKVVLNDKEKSYLNKKGKITYCIDPNWEPFAYLDEYNNHAGLTKDYINIIQKTTGLKTQFIKTKNWSETLDYLKNRKCDMTLEIAPTPTRREYLLFTDPYIKFPQVVATKSDARFISNMHDLLDKKVGIIKNYAIAEILKNKYLGFEPIIVKSAEDGLKKVAYGEIDAFIDFLPSVSRGINKVAIGNLKISGKIDEKVWLGAGTRNDEPILNTIIQKAVKNIKSEEHKAILDKWMTIKFEHGTDYKLVWKIVVISFFIIAIIIYWNRKLKKAKEKTQKALYELAIAKKEIENINDGLNQKVKQEVEKNQEQERLIFFQSKLATMGETISIIAHQWRNPIAILSSHINNMELHIKYKKEYNEEKFLETIKKSQDVIQHLSSTIDTFQNYLKPVNTNNEEQTFNLIDVLNKAQFLYQDTMKHNNIVLHNKYYDNAVSINGNGEDFIQVILTLLSNSKDAVIKNQIINPEIIIQTKVLQDNTVKIKIYDNGGGISIKPIDKIFEPYYTEKKDDGFGLGLFIAKSIVTKRYKGSLHAKSKLGRTVMTITLPIILEE